DLHCAPYDTLFDKFGQVYALQDTLFNDYVEFCCEDAGLTVDVILQVTDAGGRHNTCRVKVEVQDKTPFNIISCPERVWNLDCTQDIDTAFLGVPIIEDNCAYASLDFEDVGDINMACGQGQVIRSWFVEVNGVVQELESCRQTINVSNQNVLSYYDFDWPNQERTDATCFNYHTDLGDTVRINGVPVTELDLCAQLAYSYKDRVFQNVEGYCLKIIRTWTVIDWCTYDPNNNPDQGIWTDTQIIKVSNADGPELSNCAQDTLIQILGNTCSATVFLEAPTAYDQCFDEYLAPFKIRYELVNTDADTLVSLGLGNLLPIELHKGNYRITWTVESGCGVSSSCSASIAIVDAKAPSPYCKSGITTVLMPPGVGNEEPMVEIWASDFDLNSTDNCSEELIFSFDPNTFIPNMSFSCEELGLQGLDVWVIDEAGNKDFCHTAIMIQANGDICPQDTSNMGMAVGGDILTLQNDKLENVEVSLENMVQYNMDYKMTDQDGHFEFRALRGNEDYRVRAKKDDDHLNGVSTLDLIMIQRHILGVESLDSPYKLMAADINYNQDISAIDLIELRKLILGVYNELPDNDAWRFIDKDQTFVDALNPWPFKENIDVNNLAAPMMENDFIAVKIGDVNGSVQMHNTSNNTIESRAAKSAELSYDILEIRPNAEYLVPFYISNMEEMLGLQLELAFNTEEYEIIGIEAGKLDISDININSSEETLRISWHTTEPVILNNEEAIFYLTVKSDQRLSVGTFTVNNGFLNSEVYDSQYDIYTLDLNEQNLDVNNRLHQNIPNPFSASTEIEFDLAWDMEVTINIVDARGQLVRSYNGWYNKGRNAITVSSNDLNGNGIYYFNLESDAFSATKKMILIE
ncbi:MAG: T9SS type A sorting domain-containing protein, partial [Saprospiraceae bacterium]|nr:T9SS type A sorting domain-containing protein [Saprospiraceae bacterium]